MKTCFFIFLVAVITVSCSVAPEPIHYGEDNCVQCQMTIMDSRYGTEIVTAKGKVFKFDSVECLVDYYQDNSDKGEEYSHILFTPFDRPGTLADARSGHVLQSKNLPSPMGMFLTAFATETDAMRFKTEYSGKVYDWNGLLENFSVIRAFRR